MSLHHVPPEYVYICIHIHVFAVQFGAPVYRDIKGFEVQCPISRGVGSKDQSDFGIWAYNPKT